MRPPRRATQRVVEAVADQLIDLAKAAQHRGRQKTRESPVPRFQFFEAPVRGQGFIERSVASQHGIEQVERRFANGMSLGKRIGWRSCFESRHKVIRPNR